MSVVREREHENQILPFRGWQFQKKDTRSLCISCAKYRQPTQPQHALPSTYSICHALRTPSRCSCFSCLLSAPVSCVCGATTAVLHVSRFHVSTWFPPVISRFQVPVTSQHPPTLSSNSPILQLHFSSLHLEMHRISSLVLRIWSNCSSPSVLCCCCSSLGYSDAAVDCSP